MITEDINDAINDIMNEYGNATVEERFDDLMQKMIAFAFYIMDRQRTTGKRIQEHELQWQEDSMKQLKVIERVFQIAKKQGRIAAKPNGNFDAQLIGQMKEMKRSVGDIVVPLQSKPNADSGTK